MNDSVIKHILLLCAISPLCIFAMEENNKLKVENNSDTEINICYPAKMQDGVGLATKFNVEPKKQKISRHPLAKTVVATFQIPGCPTKNVHLLNREYPVVIKNSDGGDFLIMQRGQILKVIEPIKEELAVVNKLSIPIWIGYSPRPELQYDFFAINPTSTRILPYTDTKPKEIVLRIGMTNFYHGPMKISGDNELWIEEEVEGIISVFQGPKLVVEINIED